MLRLIVYFSLCGGSGNPPTLRRALVGLRRASVDFTGGAFIDETQNTEPVQIFDGSENPLAEAPEPAPEYTPPDGVGQGTAPDPAGGTAPAGSAYEGAGGGIYQGEDSSVTSSNNFHVDIGDGKKGQKDGPSDGADTTTAEPQSVSTGAPAPIAASLTGGRVFTKLFFFI